MTLGTILVILAGLLTIFALVLGYPRTDPPTGRYRQAWSLLAVAVLLICVALCVGIEPFVRT